MKGRKGSDAPPLWLEEDEEEELRLQQDTRKVSSFDFANFSFAPSSIVKDVKMRQRILAVQ